MPASDSMSRISSSGRRWSTCWVGGEEEEERDGDEGNVKYNSNKL